MTFSLSVLVVLAWGALAFGAEYAWAYAPLLVMTLTAGVLGIRVSRGGAVSSRALLVALATVWLAGTIQTVPLPKMIRDAAGAHAPAADYQRLKSATLQSPTASVTRTLSIASAQTMLGLAFAGSLTLFLWACVRGVSAVGPSALARGIVVLGIVVAFVGLIQSVVWTDMIYGFWRHPKASIAFAPFSNENHFAGWMVMAMSLAAGRFAGGIASALRDVPPGWRTRVLWLSSAAASETVLTGFGVGVMGLAMVITLSRGGLVGLATAAAVSIWWVLRRQSSGARRIASAGGLAFVFLAAVLWGGIGRTLIQFQGTGLDWGGRKAVWLDTLRIIRDYPWTGTGLNTYGIAMLHYQTIPRGDYFIEAHNDYLQLAAEGGLLLGIPILITIALFIREVWRRFAEGADDEGTYWLRAGAVTGLCSIAVMEIFDFTLQMPGAAVLFVVLAATAIHRPDYLTRRSEERRRGA